MQKIILDTNFLLSKFDFFSELERICDFKYQIFILDKTIEELKNKKLEKLAKDIIKKKEIKVIKTEKNKSTDNLLLDLAEKEKFIVATQDKELKQKLKQKDIKIITIRQKTHLKFD